MAECAVFGVKDALKTQVPVGLVVLKAGVTRRPRGDPSTSSCKCVREQVGPVANFKHVAIVARLPKTRSGKSAPRHDAHHRRRRAYRVPATIDDPATLDEIRAAMQSLGYAREGGSSIGGG